MTEKRYMGLKAELEPVLRDYYDNDDFVFGVLDRLSSDAQLEELARIIDYASGHDDTFTYGDIILGSIVIADGLGAYGELNR